METAKEVAALQPKIATAIKLFEMAAVLRMNGVTELSTRAQAQAELFARSVVAEFDRLRTSELSPAASATSMGIEPTICGASSTNPGVRCQLRTPHVGAHQWREGSAFAAWFTEHEADNIMRRGYEP